MGVARNLLGSERYRFTSCRFGLLIGNTIRAGAEVQRYPALKIGQIKCTLSVSAIHRTNQNKQCIVLTDWQWLSVTKHPATRRKVTGKHSYFAYIWLRHRIVSLFSVR